MKVIYAILAVTGWVWLVVVGIAVIWKVKRQRRDAQVSGVPEAASETTRMSERS